MTTTVAALADRVLGRLDIVIVPVSERPANTATVSVASIAASALQRLGVIVPASDRPGNAVIASVQDIAAAALQRLGVIVPASGRYPVTTVTPLADITRRVLEMLGVVASDEVALTDDTNTVTTALRALNDSLLARGLVSWQADAIPEPASEEYTQLGAIYLAPSFGKAADLTQRPVIEARIARIALVTGAQAMAETKVVEITASLIAHGIIDWTAIPASAAEEYIQMTAAELAPVFGQEPPDPALRAAFETRIARIALVARAQPMAEAKVAELNASMIARGNVSWTDIPLAAAEQYIQITALALAPLFGQEADVKLFAMLEDRIRQISVIARAPDDAKDAVMAVHTELASSDKVRWSVFDIPPAAEQPYVVKAANRIAMNFGKQVDARAEARADVLLARIIALPTSGEVTRAEYF